MVELYSLAYLVLEHVFYPHRRFLLVVTLPIFSVPADGIRVVPFVILIFREEAEEFSFRPRDTASFPCSQSVSDLYFGSLGMIFVIVDLI